MKTNKEEVMCELYLDALERFDFKVDNGMFVLGIRHNPVFGDSDYVPLHVDASGCLRVKI